MDVSFITFNIKTEKKSLNRLEITLGQILLTCKSVWLFIVGGNFIPFFFLILVQSCEVFEREGCQFTIDFTACRI